MHDAFTILWKQFLNYMLLHEIEFYIYVLSLTMKTRTCDSFTSSTLVDLPLYVHFSTSELVLIACRWTHLTVIGSISAQYILLVSLSAYRLCSFYLSAHRGRFILFDSTNSDRACQAPEKLCGGPEQNLIIGEKQQSEAIEAFTNVLSLGK